MVYLIEVVLLAYFTAAVLYTLLPSVAGRLVRRKKPFASSSDHKNIAILVPAYREDAVIVPIAKKLLTQKYPQDRFDVVIIADSLQDDTLASLRQLPIKLLIADFEKSTKTKSLVFALESLGDAYDIALISDADNIMEESFLQKINDASHAGYQAIQGRRVAKNLNTPFAVLDATSEIINNHIYRRGFNALGLSSSLIGSGMAFNARDLLECLKQIDAVGGFDRVLQLFMIGKNHHIIYLEDALIYDEKVESSAAFTSQRRRWMSSQFVYLGRYLRPGLQALFRGDIDYFNASVLYNVFLPRVINLGLLFIFTVAALALSPYLTLGFWPWVSLLLLNVLSLAIAVPGNFFTGKLLKALLSLPKVFFIMFLLLFRLKGADKKFIHTEHKRADIDDSVSY